MSEKPLVPGGAWLLTSALPENVFLPEDFGEDRQKIAEAALRFARERLQPIQRQLETHHTGPETHALYRGLMAECGAQGLLGVDAGEEYGGMHAGLISSCLVFEQVARAGGGSFATCFAAHTGIGTIPVLLYGNDEQRQRYVPKLVSGEWIGAYCLTEAGSGSDAFNCKTTATLSPDGTHFVLNGGKIYITNGGFADLFTVFAKAGGKNACFLLERDTPGFTVGAEEDKVGIRGSSTVVLSFDDAKIPAANLLGEIGKGHHVVMNTLNIGRLKLAVGGVALSKNMIDVSVAHALERKQFGKTLAEFEAIGAKIADMTVDAWVNEAMTYRVAELLERRIAAGAPLEGQALECALVKVAGSEAGFRCADEAVQILGGLGFIEEYEPARAYRDCRINRIFEGTNEINRLACAGALLKNGTLKGVIPLLAAVAKSTDVEALQHELVDSDGYEVFLRRAKAAAVFAIGLALQKHQMAIDGQQQILFEIADALIAIYGMESAYLRTWKLAQRRSTDEQTQELQDKFMMVDLCFAKGQQQVAAACQRIVSSLPEAAKNHATLAKLLDVHHGDWDVHGLKRELAKVVFAAGKYPF